MRRREAVSASSFWLTRTCAVLTWQVLKNSSVVWAIVLLSGRSPFVFLRARLRAGRRGSHKERRAPEPKRRDPPPPKRPPHLERRPPRPFSDVPYITYTGCCYYCSYKAWARLKNTCTSMAGCIQQGRFSSLTSATETLSSAQGQTWGLAAA